MACTINLPGFNRIPLSADYATWESFFFPHIQLIADYGTAKTRPVHSGRRYCKERRAQADGIGGAGWHLFLAEPSTHAVCLRRERRPCCELIFRGFFCFFC